VTAKPVVAGPQTAVVVGPPGEEIFCDKYGRVKVQFRWDREGTFNDKSSCWIRVAQIWAGKAWGSQYVPRIGQEVVVSFLDGNPDQPLIVGSIYNRENEPPFNLPDDAQISGFKTDSTKSAKGGYNELSFDDKAGQELILIHAQKNMRTVIEENSELRAKQEITIEAGTRLVLQAGTRLELQVGAATVVLDAAGIAITGALNITGPTSIKGATSVSGVTTLTGGTNITGATLINGKPPLV
jgi:type VI secretion system secreted protein VgrG